MLIAHLGETQLAASTMINLDWGLANQQAIMIYAAELNLAILIGAATTVWWAGVAADPEFVAAVDFDTARWVISSPLLVSGFVGRDILTSGMAQSQSRSVSQYPEGYLTTRNLRASFLEIDLGNDLTFSIEVHYKRVELTEDEQTSLIAVRNR